MINDPAATSSGVVTKADGLSRRDWLLVLAGAAGAAVLTLGLLASRAVAAPDASAIGTPPPAVASAASPAEVLAPKWSSANRARWIGESRKSAAFDLAADNRVQVWTRQVQPTLVVRCQSNAIEVFVFTETAARIEPDTDDHTITYTFDDDATVTQRWTDSVEHDGLFAPNAAAFAERLIRARRLTFGFTPHNAAPVNVVFSVSGLGDLLGPVAESCGRQTD